MLSVLEYILNKCFDTVEYQYPVNFDPESDKPSLGSNIEELLVINLFMLKIISLRKLSGIFS